VIPGRSAIVSTRLVVELPSAGYSTVEPRTALIMARSSSPIWEGPSSPIETPACGAWVTDEQPAAVTIEPRYLKLEDVAIYLSVSVPQVYALVRSGELPAIKLGGRGVWRVDRAKLDAYLEKLEAETAVWARAHPLNPKEKEPRAER
jgi:excisionase family DNA binding protein